MPLYALIVLRWLRDRLRDRRSHMVRRRTTIVGSVLRVDAKAEGLTVAVGGWAQCVMRRGRSMSADPRGSH